MGLVMVPRTALTRSCSSIQRQRQQSCIALQARLRPGPPDWRRQQLTAHRVRRRAVAARLAFDPELLTDPEVPLSKLQELLDAAVEDEDYAVAAQLRDSLQKRRFDCCYAVEEANDRFYKAFQAGSLKDMASIWGTGEHVQCVHPMAGCIAGRQAVMEGWKTILGAGRMKIKVEDVRTFASDRFGYVTCMEIMEASESRGRILATNVFEKQGAQWKIVHHHGSVVRMLV